ncbi:MAG: patatin [Archangium gephyra]|uniref:Patatin n=1 Tax=Archangium gephyra TaxID=48 RepID=A0A2W5VD33_9BACT|nr:MAG: patatin [Archangium gephyra]
MELQLVRAAIARPGLVNAHEEAVLRTALSLARLYKVRHAGRDIGIGSYLEPFREEMTRRLKPVLLPPRGNIEREQLLPHLRELKERTINTRDQLVRRVANRLPFEAIDREIRHKQLVLVMGGGGGTAYVYLGVMSLLDDYGLLPKLLVGTSMGSILALFRSRMPRYEQDEVVGIVRSLSWRKLFRTLSTENRYGIPAALRLFLRSGIGRYFGVDSRGNDGPRLSQLPIKTIIAVSGIRRGKLPHPLEWYEKLIASSPRQLLNPLILPRWFQAIAEFTTRPDILTRVHLGADEGTADFDALDAAGFSSALPGIIHYDVFRDDPRMHALLNQYMGDHGISRFIDGGLVDNVPSRAAWRAVHKGEIGTRNAFILALNGFSMKLTTPLWLALERLAELNVAKNRPWAHLTHDFKRTLSPLTIVPTVEQLLTAVDVGRSALARDMQVVARVMAPLPRLAPAPV